VARWLTPHDPLPPPRLALPGAMLANIERMPDTPRIHTSRANKEPQMHHHRTQASSSILFLAKFNGFA